MPRIKIDKDTIIMEAAHMANETGIENLSLKTLAARLGVKSPSLYNHVDGLDDLKRQVMLYGWKEMEDRMIQAVIGVTGYDAVRAMCHAFHKYATENQGVFSAMLWFNQFEDEQTLETASRMTSIFFKITDSLNISQENCCHLVRMFRGFLEGFALLENHHAFGNAQPIEESFHLAVDILIEGMKKLEEKGQHGGAPERES